MCLIKEKRFTRPDSVSSALIGLQCQISTKACKNVCKFLNPWKTQYV